MAISLHAHADPAQQQEHGQSASQQLATGQFITPTALRGAVQQALNPRLPAYPDFVAGEAVRAQLSPDGTTLAILCAGQNSLYKPDGSHRGDRRARSRSTSGGGLPARDADLHVGRSDARVRTPVPPLARRSVRSPEISAGAPL